MSPHRSCALDAAATALGTRICTIKPCIEYGTCTICTLHLYSRAGSFLTELSHTHTSRRAHVAALALLYKVDVVFMHRNVDFLRDGDFETGRGEVCVSSRLRQGTGSVSSMSEVTNVKVTKRSRAPAQDHAKPQHQYVVFPLLL